MFKNIAALLKLTSELNKSMAEVKFEMVKTTDGLEINLSSREVGAEVTQGEAQPVADGSYTLEDGFAFTVKDGLIESIEASVETIPEEEVKEELADDVHADAPVAADDEKQKEIDSLKEKIAELEAKIAELSGQFNADKYATKEDFQSLQTVFTALNDAVKIMAKMPAEFSKVSETFKEKSQKEINQERLMQAFRR